MKLLKAVALAWLMTALPVAAQTNVELNSEADSVTASFTLTPTVSLDFSIAFEKAVGLTAENFTVNAELLTLNDPRVVNRLPNRALMSMPAALPVLISVEPDPNKGFSFSGDAVIELYTKSLHYTAGTPLRLFHSHGNDSFKDITLMTGSGSYRVRGSTGQFSDFIVLADLRSNAAVIATKLERLNQFADSVRQTLSFQAETLLMDSVNQLSDTISDQQYTDALTQLDELVETLEADNGSLYPDVWRSSGDVINVRGQLLSLTKTLRYSLRIN